MGDSPVGQSNIQGDTCKVQNNVNQWLETQRTSDKNRNKERGANKVERWQSQHRCSVVVCGCISIRKRFWAFVRDDQCSFDVECASIGDGACSIRVFPLQKARGKCNCHCTSYIQRYVSSTRFKTCEGHHWLHVIWFIRKNYFSPGTPSDKLISSKFWQVS